MKAAVWYGKHDVRVEDREVPVIQSGKIKIKVAWAGICGSDLHAYHGFGVQEIEPHPVSGEMAPLVLGHEFSGVVDEIGEGVKGFAVGDRVTVEPLIYCGHCENCKKGNYNLCNHFGFVGLQANGGFAEYVLVEPYMVHKLPEGMSLEEGALVEPTAVVLHAVKQSRLKVGDNVAVFGVGPIGLLTVIAAQAAGATQIIAVDVSDARLEKAKEAGATITINAMNENSVEAILAATGGVDVAYEVAGAEVTLNNALASIRKQGEVVIISIIPTPVNVDVLQLTLKEAYLTATLGYRHIFPEVIEMIAAGKLNVKNIVTKKIMLDDIIEEGFETLLVDKSQSKILVNVQG